MSNSTSIKFQPHFRSIEKFWLEHWYIRICCVVSCVYLATHCTTGVGGYEGDGDITKTDNVEAFQNYIMECTDNQGVHFVMADGVSYTDLLAVLILSC